MTIPLDNLYDYIFNITRHNNKNLIMYRFSPHGSKNIKNLIIHNNAELPKVKINNRYVSSWHHKHLFCYDQEPLDFDLYKNNFEDIKFIFEKEIGKGKENEFNNPIMQKIILNKNICSNPNVTKTVYDKKLLLHSEKNSIDLEKYEKNGFLGVYYWSHAFIALDWYRFAKHDISLNSIPKTNFAKDFNIYSRGWTGSREYRLKFLEILKQNNIDKKSNIFFNEYCDDKHYSIYTTKNKKWKVKKENIDNLICHTSRKIHSSASASYDVYDYKNSAIDIVLETVFDRNKIQLTEKILRPIACGKPFILVSEKGSLEYIKSYGFKTFDTLIDEDYDSISDPEKRLYAIVETMKKFSQIPQNEKNRLLSKMHDIATENKKWFFSQDFFKIINNELIRNMTEKISLLDNPEYQTAKEIRYIYRAHKFYKNLLPESQRSYSDRVISEYPERIRLSKENIGVY